MFILHCTPEVLCAHCGDLAVDRANYSNSKYQKVLTGLTKMCDDGVDPRRMDAILDIGSSRPHIMHDMCPCLTKARASDMGYFSVKRMRLLEMDEMMKLQGANPDMFQGWQDVISVRQMGSLVGNAMTQWIVERLLRRIFKSLGVPVKGIDPLGE